MTLAALAELHYHQELELLLHNQAKHQEEITLICKEPLGRQHEDHFQFELSIVSNDPFLLSQYFLILISNHHQQMEVYQFLQQFDLLVLLIWRYHLKLHQGLIQLLFRYLHEALLEVALRVMLQDSQNSENHHFLYLQHLHLHLHLHDNY